MTDIELTRGQRLALAIEHIDNAHTEGEYIACHPACPGCLDSCPCRRGHRLGLLDGDDCHICYPPDDPEGIQARERAITGLLRAGWSTRDAAERLGTHQTTVQRVSERLDES